jgi:hypothetical protein
VVPRETLDVLENKKSLAPIGIFFSRQPKGLSYDMVLFEIMIL